MEKTTKELRDEIKEHRQKGVDLLREGQEIHQAYQRAPESHNLTEEVSAFIEKATQGSAEFDKAIDIQKEFIDCLRADDEGNL